MRFRRKVGKALLSSWFAKGGIRKVYVLVLSSSLILFAFTWLQIGDFFIESEAAVSRSVDAPIEGLRNYSIEFPLEIHQAIPREIPPEISIDDYIPPEFSLDDFLEGIPNKDPKDGPREGEYVYNVCNGLSNQILHHAIAITRAVKEKRPVAIFDNFIFNGVQHTNENELPTAANAVRMAEVFDMDYLMKTIEDFGIQARLVTPDWNLPKNQRIPCVGITRINTEDAQIAMRIMKAFRPTGIIKDIVTSTLETMKIKGFDVSQGVCLHHRDGRDWHKHCARWSAITIKDGIYRGNCLDKPKETILESLESRALILPRWLYYVGDHDIPQKLVHSKYNVVSKNDFVDSTAMAKFLNNLPEGPYRDLWSLIDSFICSSLPWFVGNSVSTWSAIQIAKRQATISEHGSGSYWYNSQSIPLAEFIPMYQIPIVYTYTEMSAGAGKFLLKASISSVRKQMPYNTIHIIYHGKKDEDFRVWLMDNAVILHHHDPKWRKDIEVMRRAGNSTRSHLFLHEGNYFGTWQRIDIPKFITSEYCLLLDSDTIVVKPFTFDEFGLKLTNSVAFSAEGNPEDTFPWNAGVSLMNVPHLKKTYQKFFHFIMQPVERRGYHVSGRGNAVSDQGAYLIFYKKSIQFLSIDFNFKPYYNVTHAKAASAKIVHFHGPKPHDYIGHVSGVKCDKAAQGLCDRAGKINTKYLCSNVQAFAKSLFLSGEDNIMGYCEVVYATNKDYQGICFFTLKTLAASVDVCTDLSLEVNNAKVGIARKYTLSNGR